MQDPNQPKELNPQNGRQSLMNESCFCRSLDMVIDFRDSSSVDFMIRATNKTEVRVERREGWSFYPEEFFCARAF